MRARNPLGPLTAVRVVATSAALDAMRWPDGAFAMRTAADEALVVAGPGHDGSLRIAPDAVPDPHAIIDNDTSWRGVWVDTAAALDIIEHHADWEAPSARPSLAQGLIAGIAAKVWLGHAQSLIAVTAPFAADFEERVR